MDDLIAVGIVVLLLIAGAYLLFSPRVSATDASSTAAVKANQVDTTASNACKKINNIRTYDKLSAKLQSFKSNHAIVDSDIISISYHEDCCDISGIVTLVNELSSLATVVVLSPAHSDEEESRVKEQLSCRIPAIALPVYRILFYETIIGKTSQLRQLAPNIHFEYDVDVCRIIAPHIKRVYFATSGKLNEAGANLAEISSIKLVDAYKNVFI